MAVVLVGGLTAATFATPSITDEELQRLVDRLDAPTYADREDAARDLHVADWTPDQVRRVLELKPLSAEQRHRLLRAYESRVLNKPRGALGIRMQYHPGELGPDDRPLPGEIQVTHLVEDMPALEVLMLGDRITHIDGRAPLNNDDLIKWVQARKPGHIVTLSVRRTRRTPDNEQFTEDLEIPLKLGSAVDLNEPASSLSQNSIVQARQFDVAQVRSRYGAHPKRIQASHIWNKGAYGFDLESHPLIRRTRLQILQIEAGRASVTSKLRAEWEFQLRDLDREIRLARDPAMREELELVRDRYLTMIQGPVEGGD